MAGNRGKRWVEREGLRGKGQFWTPDWVADAMVAYAVRDARTVFDPAVGGGAFAAAVQLLAKAGGRRIRFEGCELDERVLAAARDVAGGRRSLGGVRIANFLEVDALPAGANVVANPPYVRHHRLGAKQKDFLRRIAVRNLGAVLDGRAGIHVFFLIHALSLLRSGGRLCFIMPADTCEGVFARTLWEWIGGRFRLEAVITFAPEATPFPGVDTNPVIFMIRKSEPQSQYVWSRCMRAGGRTLLAWVKGGFRLSKRGAVRAERREVRDGIAQGIARERVLAAPPKYVLGDFARTMRGIATGANEFFCLTRRQVDELGLEEELLVRAVGRTRDVSGDTLRMADLDLLESEGRATHLLVPDGRPLSAFSARTRAYLEHGMAIGLPSRALIAQRKPWYRMERRKAPRFLFAYLGRRNARFIRNEAGAWPLTGFLCVYPRGDSERFQERLWRILQDEETLRNLALVGKSYGGGAVKVEPRALERLPLPTELVERLGLHSWLAEIAERRGDEQLLLGL